MAKTSTIITIGRQYGSAGREIGYKVADELGIKLYDKEMLNRAAKESGICQELFETHDESPQTASFILWSWIRILLDIHLEAIQICRLTIRYFWRSLTRSKRLQKRGPCILVGRCADYALEGYDNVLSLFIHANLDARIRRIARLYDLTDAKGKKSAS